MLRALAASWSRRGSDVRKLDSDQAGRVSTQGSKTFPRITDTVGFIQKKAADETDLCVPRDLEENSSRRDCSCIRDATRAASEAQSETVYDRAGPRARRQVDADSDEKRRDGFAAPTRASRLRSEADLAKVARSRRLRQGNERVACWVRAMRAGDRHHCQTYGWRSILMAKMRPRTSSTERTRSLSRSHTRCGVIARHAREHDEQARTLKEASASAR